MKTVKIALNAMLLMVLLGMLSCGTSKDANTVKSKEELENVGNTVDVDQAHIPLSSYLKRVPGVSVMGAGDNVRVLIRGASNSANTNNSPLFVVDGVRVGNSYAAASNMIDVNDIGRVKVLKGADASSEYGMQGANGVIVITSKKKN